jgi:outer membrane translocation and assembly module TamA
VSDFIGQPKVCITRPFSNCSGIDFPQFLDADAVGLRVGVGAQVELRLDLLAEVAAAAFGEQGVFGQQFHAGLVVGAGLAVAPRPMSPVATPRTAPCSS